MEGKQRGIGFFSLIPALLVITLILLLFPGCEQVFTTSPVAFLARDPSSLPEEQQVSYAQQALASGDQATLQEAYAAIASSTDPDVQYLASQVAIGASGINEAIQSIDISDPSSIDTAALLGSLDAEYLTNAGDKLAAAGAAGVAVSDEDYVVAAASLILAGAIDDGDPETYISSLDFETLTNDPPEEYSEDLTEAEKAAYLFNQTDLTADDMDSLLGMIGG